MSEATAPTSTPMDALDRLANDAFAGRVVRKDLVRQVKVGANVPVYVLEFLLGKYCASDDPAAIATGLQSSTRLCRRTSSDPTSPSRQRRSSSEGANTASSTRSTSGSSPARTSSGPTSRTSGTSTSTSPRTSSTSTSGSGRRRLVPARPSLQRGRRGGEEATVLHPGAQADPGRRVRHGRVHRGPPAIHARRVARPRDAIDRSRTSALRPAGEASRLAAAPADGRAELQPDRTRARGGQASPSSTASRRPTRS